VVLEQKNSGLDITTKAKTAEVVAPV